jgi:hypothetical protein
MSLVTPSTVGNSDVGALALRFRNVSVAVSVHENTRVQLCGQMSVEIDGVEVAQGLRGRQVRLLLAYLLLNRTRAVGRE